VISRYDLVKLGLDVFDNHLQSSASQPARQIRTPNTKQHPAAIPHQITKPRPNNRRYPVWQNTAVHAHGSIILHRELHILNTAKMADRQLSQILAQLKSTPPPPYETSTALLSKAKLHLLHLGALTPTPKTPASILSLARETYEQGALLSIRAKNPEGFTANVQKLQAFYELPTSVLPPNLAERNKVTGLYLLLLLTQGRYSEFHSELEALANREGGGSPGDVEGDRYLGYPIHLERWLMEGSYDRVWKAMKSREVPCEEYGVFSEV
jgi:hypothetical protein